VESGFGTPGCGTANNARSTVSKTPESAQSELSNISGQAATSDILEEAHRSGHLYPVIAKPSHPTDLLAKISELFAIPKDGKQDG
jgi:hypothetical protein